MHGGGVGIKRDSGDRLAEVSRTKIVTLGEQGANVGTVVFQMLFYKGK